MSNNRITGISAESIQDINDVKTWARNHEISMNDKVSVMQTSISDLQERDDKLQIAISRNIRLWIITSIAFGIILCVIVFSAVVNVIPIIKGMF